MSFGNVPPDTIEKLLARMDETDLAAFYERELSAMPSEAVHAFVEALFESFRDRGESSEDAAEGAGTSLDAIASNERPAVAALLRYARTSSDLVKEATMLFIERRPDLIAALPAVLREALAARSS
jgi:hypothetical protein